MQNEVGGGATKVSARRLSARLPGVENRWGGWGDQIRKGQLGGEIFAYPHSCSVDGREIVESAAHGNERMGKARKPHRAQSISIWSSGCGAKSGILERAVAEGVIKSLTVRDLVTPCLQGSYRNGPFGIEILVARC
jgi:hypothetical protein